MMKKIISFLEKHPYTSLIFILALSFAVSIFSKKTETAEANIALGGEYGPVGTGYSTTTSALFNNPAKITLIKGGRGSFGSVNVLETGTGGGDFEFYDATTSNPSLRAASLASSTIFLGSIPNDATAREYRFDLALQNGLLMVYNAGATVATTTITVR